MSSRTVRTAPLAEANYSKHNFSKLNSLSLPFMPTNWWLLAMEQSICPISFSLGVNPYKWSPQNNGYHLKTTKETNKKLAFESVVNLGLICVQWDQFHTVIWYLVWEVSSLVREKCTFVGEVSDVFSDVWYRLSSWMTELQNISYHKFSETFDAVSPH